jgi:hypothetical protein
MSYYSSAASLPINHCADKTIGYGNPQEEDHPKQMAVPLCFHSEKMVHWRMEGCFGGASPTPDTSCLHSLGG